MVGDVLWTGAYGSSTNGRLVRMGLDGSDPEVVLDQIPGVTYLEPGGDGGLVMKTYQGFYEVTADGTATPIPGTSSDPLLNNVFDFALDGDTILGANNSGQIVQLPRAGGPATTLLTTPSRWAIDLADDGTLYWSDLSSGTVSMLPDGATEPETVVTGLNQPTGLLAADIPAEVVDPTVTARVSSLLRPNAAGWYRRPATIRYTCTEGSAPVTCPSDVTRNNAGPGAEIVRVARAEDGGRAVSRVVLNVDVVNPRITTRRVGDNPYARDQRPIRCTATDERSGIAGACEVTYGPVVTGPAGGLRRSWTARVTDVAGNRAEREGFIAIRR